MKNYIKKRLHEDLEHYHVDNAKPESNKFEIGLDEGPDKFGMLEIDLRDLMQKHKDNFAQFEGDNYGIIDAMHQVMEGMFQRVNQ